jgi:hypothetical protein
MWPGAVALPSPANGGDRGKLRVPRVLCEGPSYNESVARDRFEDANIRHPHTVVSWSKHQRCVPRRAPSILSQTGLLRTD